MYTEAIQSLAEQASVKLAEQRRSLLGHVVRSMLAGMYVGASIVLVFTVGGLYWLGSPRAREQARKAAEGAALEGGGLTPAFAESQPRRAPVGQPVPVGPLIYRFHEITQVYGMTLKALIHEMFGDDIMSAIDFEMDVQRKEDPKGDRVVITMSGKFLPYKVW